MAVIHVGSKSYGPNSIPLDIVYSDDGIQIYIDVFAVRLTASREELAALTGLLSECLITLRNRKVK